MRAILCLIISVCLHFQVLAQAPKKTTITEYIDLYKADAIKDMMRMGVPASITLAQGILESESGNSDLAREARNHFGIKCHKEWTGATFHKDDDERDECFRKYNTVLESYDDHGRFLRERPRYAFLFDYEITDYKSWAHGLKQAGYATNPRYAELLIKLIEQYDLSQYDKNGKKIPVVAGAAIPAPVRSPETSKPEAKPKAPQQVVINKNDVPYYVAKKGDSWFAIAMAHDMRLWQLLKYNDAEKNYLINEGDPVYLKPKRGRASASTHVVAEGESLWQISQQYGIKLKRLEKLNNLEGVFMPEPGKKIKLN